MSARNGTDLVSLFHGLASRFGWKSGGRLALRLRAAGAAMARCLKIVDHPPAIKLAAASPLLDAALLVWLRRRELQHWDRKSSSRRLRGDFFEQIEQAIGAADFERENAAGGPTFDRLKIAHPEADDSSLRQAIERAVKLERDCARHFAHSAAGLQSDAQRAADRARADNPGFLETSYAAAARYLCTMMR